MLEWLIAQLGSWQAGIVRSLAGELRAGGIGAAALAFALGALHALTPGHGKAALAAYFLGRDAHVGKGLRVALSAALLHVLSGFVAFLVLRLILGQTPWLLGRGPPGFAVVGYGLIIVAGVLMLVQSLRSSSSTHDVHALTAGIGLLPCPLTISVLGFAWLQSSIAMVGVVLLSLALGISATIGIVAVAAILARASMGAALAHRLPQLERGSRILQGAAAIAIITLGTYALATLHR
jgi:ABC-type nickel/cobalt efflux system permease component RcnA